MVLFCIRPEDQLMMGSHLETTVRVVEGHRSLTAVSEHQILLGHQETKLDTPQRNPAAQQYYHIKT